MNLENDSEIHSLKDLLIRFNIVIFIVILTGVLIFCIAILNSIITQPNEVNSGSSGINANQTSFDEATKIQLKRLKTSAENTDNQTLPSGKINPFSE